MKSEETNFESNEFIEALTKWLYTPKISIVYPKRLKELKYTIRMLEELLEEENIEAKIKIMPCPLGTGDVIIKFNTYSLSVRNTEKFYEVIRHMSNFEIYSTDDEIIHFAGVVQKFAFVSPIYDKDENSN